MITFMTLICIFILVAFVVMMITGIAASMPGILVIIGFIMVDVLMYKLIFGRKKK